MPKLKSIARNLDTLSLAELNKIDALVHGLIEDRAEPADEITPEPAADHSKSRKSNKRKSGEWDETKIINGHAYRYHRFWQGGRLRSKYIGKV